MKNVQPDMLADGIPPQGASVTIASNGHELVVVPPEDLQKLDKVTADLAREDAPQQDEVAEFDWMTDDSIVLRPQLAVAIYQNERGGLVIRQERDWNEDNDTFIVISPENIPAFIDRITDVAGVPSFGGPEPKPVAVRKR